MRGTPCYLFLCLMFLSGTTVSFASATICSPENDHTQWGANVTDQHDKYVYTVKGKDLPIQYQRSTQTTFTSVSMTFSAKWDDVWASPTIRIAPHPNGGLQLIDATDEWTTAHNYLNTEYDGILGMGFISKIPLLGPLISTILEIYNPFVGNVSANPPSRSGTEFRVSVTPSKCVKLSDVSGRNALYWYLNFLYQKHAKLSGTTPEQAETKAEDFFKKYLESHEQLIKESYSEDKSNAWKAAIPQLIRNDYNIYLHEENERKVPYVRVRQVNIAGTLCPINFIEKDGLYSEKVMTRLVGRVTKFPVTSSSEGVDTGEARLGPQVFTGTQVSDEVDTILQGAKFAFSTDIAKSLNALKSLKRLLRDTDDYGDIGLPDNFEEMLSNVPAYSLNDLGGGVFGSQNRPKFVLQNANTEEKKQTARAFFNMCGWSLGCGGGGNNDAFPKRVCPPNLEKDGTLDKSVYEECKTKIRPICGNGCLPGSGLTVRKFVGTGEKRPSSSEGAQKKTFLATLTTALLALADKVLTYNDANIATLRYQSRELAEGKVVQSVWYALKEVASFYSAYLYCNGDKKRWRDESSLLRRIYLAYTDHGMYFGPNRSPNKNHEYFNVTGWNAVSQLPWYVSGGGWIESIVATDVQNNVVENVEGYFSGHDRELTYCKQLRSKSVDTNYRKTPVPDLPPYHYFGFFGRNARDRDLEHPANGIKLLYKYGWDYLTTGSLALPRFADGGCKLANSETDSDCARYFIMKLAKDVFGPLAVKKTARERTGQFYKIVKKIFQESEENSSFWMNYLEESSATSIVTRRKPFPPLPPTFERVKGGHAGWIHFPHLTVLERMINTGFQALDPGEYRWSGRPRNFGDARRFCSQGAKVAYRMATGVEARKVLQDMPDSWKDRYHWVSNRCSNEMLKNADDMPLKAWAVKWDSKFKRADAKCFSYSTKLDPLCVRRYAGDGLIGYEPSSVRRDSGQVRVGVSALSGGSVRIYQDGRDRGSQASFQMYTDEVQAGVESAVNLKLKATPEEGKVFSGWSGETCICEDLKRSECEFKVRYVDNTLFSDYYGLITLRKEPYVVNCAASFRDKNNQPSQVTQNKKFFFFEARGQELGPMGWSGFEEGPPSSDQLVLALEHRPLPRLSNGNYRVLIRVGEGEELSLALNNFDLNGVPKEKTLLNDGDCPCGNQTKKSCEFSVKNENGKLMLNAGTPREISSGYRLGCQVVPPAE